MNKNKLDVHFFIDKDTFYKLDELKRDFQYKNDVKMSYAKMYNLIIHSFLQYLENETDKISKLEELKASYEGVLISEK